MTDIQKFIERCKMMIVLDLPDGEKQEGTFHSDYLLDQLEKGVSLEEFFIGVRSHFDED